MFDGERTITSRGWKIKRLQELVPGVLAVDLNSVFVKFIQLKTTILCGKTVQYSQGNWLLEHSQYCIRRQNVLTRSDIKCLEREVECCGEARITGHVERALAWPLVDDN